MKKPMSRGSIFFLQKRMGRKGKRFTVIKLRTMMHKHERKKIREMLQEAAFGKKPLPPQWLTKRGKFLRRYFLDEMPQIVNILKGDMRLVGIRPMKPREFRQFPENFQKKYALDDPGFISNLYAEKPVPEGLEEQLKSSLKYLREREKSPLRTDIR